MRIRFEYYLRSLTKFIALFLVRAYQLILSPFLGGGCRFEPTCSQYAVDVLHKHSPMTSFQLIVRRLSKCHPWGGSGYDPAPESSNELAIQSHPNSPIRERSFIS